MATVEQRSLYAQLLRAQAARLVEMARLVEAGVDPNDLNAALIYVIKDLHGEVIS